ncbi:MAG: hypothetical protein AAGK21_00560 [Bacteroidota bacterium]
MPAPAPQTTALGTLVAIAAASLIGLHSTDVGLDALLRRFHLKPASTAEWVALQPLPGMYNFANRVTVLLEPVPWSRLDSEPDSFRMYHVNHYPPREITFANKRQLWRHNGCPWYLYAESAVRGRVLRTRFTVTKEEAGVRLWSSEPVPEC